MPPKDKTDGKATDTQTDTLPTWDGTAYPEKYCALCVGMVNGNGCAKEVCPVRAK